MIQSNKNQKAFSPLKVNTLLKTQFHAKEKKYNHMLEKCYPRKHQI